jgi:hypothetical protein
MNVQHTGPEPVYLPAVEDWVKPRHMVDVPEDVGQSLVDQGWTSARSKAAKKAAKRAPRQTAVPVREQQAEPNPTNKED